MDSINRDYAHYVGVGYFDSPELCKNCKRYIPYSQPTERNLIWTMPHYDEKTGKCPLHEPKANRDNN